MANYLFLMNRYGVLIYFYINRYNIGLTDYVPIMNESKCIIVYNYLVFFTNLLHFYTIESNIYLIIYTCYYARKQ